MTSVEEALLAGDRLSLSRFLTKVENNDPQARQVLDALYKHIGKAHRIGITGAPGTGKSSLVNRLTAYIRTTLKKTVAVVAVDPSSPFTGGAILGDRVRMRDLAGDAGVFIRSVASRGAVGGLSATTARLVQVFDAAGFDYIIVETVGAGQAEIEIAHVAHTTLVVEAPGFGDDIQAIKAGIMEIADILVINKADLPGADNTERALRSNLELGYTASINRKAGHAGETKVVTPEPAGWVPPIIKTVATGEEGIADLYGAIESHFGFLQQSGRLDQMQKERLHKEILDALQERLLAPWQTETGLDKLNSALKEVDQHRWSPDQAVDWLLDHSR